MFEKASQTIHCYLDHCCTNKTFKSLHVFLYRRAIGIGFIVTEVLRNEKSHRSQSLFLCKELRVHSHISPCFQDVLYNKLKKKSHQFQKEEIVFPSLCIQRPQRCRHSNLFRSSLNRSINKVPSPVLWADSEVLVLLHEHNYTEEQSFLYHQNISLRLC